ncbi:SDR family oxidoreductase [Zavarzinella formosa]|uniref:SDR family oxidoreductase n=1 Tax=Zavarzinella formosa TaxID=360055 RepID=UPI0002D32EF7|nr:SDR family oxidoreductase [Zavarzinella formosa]
MPESALIIGCGYLGRVVARRWIAKGFQISALTRSKPAELAALGITPVIGDVTEPASLVLPASDHVLYAVGMDRTAGKTMRDVYLTGLANLLERLPPTKSFIYVSSTSVYGHTNGEWVDEASATQPIEESGKLLLECEHLLHSKKPEAIILRFAGIYGPGRVIRRAAIERDEPLTADPEKWLNLIHVHDGAAIVEDVSDRPQQGEIFNVSDGTPVTRRDFYTQMAILLNAPPARFNPPVPGETTGTHDQTNRRISNKKLRDAYATEFEFPDAESGLRASIG